MINRDEEAQGVEAEPTRRSFLKWIASASIGATAAFSGTMV